LRAEEGQQGKVDEAVTGPVTSAHDPTADSGVLARGQSSARMPLPRREPVDLDAFLDGLRGMYAFRIEGEVPDRPGWFDPGQVQQVVINLLKNAHEAGSAPDGVTIALAFTAAGVLLLSVSDCGEGMSEAMLRSAIVPFSSSKPGGAGVGLVLCHEVVRGHGGSMILRSRVHEGTTVTCVLPAVIPGRAYGRRHHPRGVAAGPARSRVLPAASARRSR
jgi:two-component system nitrogen regulation sensor histidine kinase NtrY